MIPETTIDCGTITRIRHYRGLERTLPRLERLLTEFRFSSVLPPAAA